LEATPPDKGAEPTCEQRDKALIIGRSFRTVTSKTLIPWCHGLAAKACMMRRPNTPIY